MKEKIYLIEDIHADYNRFYLNKANNKKEALEKFWKDFNVDLQNKLDKEEGYRPRTKGQFEVIDITKVLKDKTIGID